jgi:hypothetical protein
MRYVLRALTFFAIAVTLVARSAVAAPAAPVVVIYPLTMTGIGDPGAGERIASLIGLDLQATGSVETRKPSPGIEREAYLDTARKLGADYYVSGFVTVISGQLSVVEQLVSTRNNTTVWSNNARLASYDDAKAQGDLVRAAVIGHEGRALAVFDLAPRAASRVPVARASPAPHDSPVPASVAKPSFAVLLIGGKATENDRYYTDTAIVKTLRSRGFIADAFDDPAGDFAVLGPAICASTGVGVLLGGALVVERMDDREINQWATADLELTAYDCATNHVLEPRAAVAATYNWKWAVDRAIAVALKNYVPG